MSREVGMSRGWVSPWGGGYVHGKGMSIGVGMSKGGYV